MPGPVNRLAVPVSGCGAPVSLRHDGATIGQGSRLRILPEEGLAVTLVGNGPGLEQVYRDLFSELFSELAGLAMPAWPERPEVAPDIDLTRYEGSYERLAVRYDLTANDDRLERALHDCRRSFANTH